MSIVTDALNRLQSMRAQRQPPTINREPEPSTAENVTIEEDSGESTRTARFLTVSVGSFLVVATMAMGAFWWGESLVENVPHVTLSAPLHADETPEPIVALSDKLPPAEQNVPVGLENNDLSEEPRVAVSQELQPQADVVSLHETGMETPQEIVRLSPPTRSVPSVIGREKPKEAIVSLEEESLVSETPTAKPQTANVSDEIGDASLPEKGKALPSESELTDESRTSNDSNSLTDGSSGEDPVAIESSIAKSPEVPSTKEVAKVVVESHPTPSSSLPTLAAKIPDSSRETPFSSTALSERKSQASSVQSSGRLTSEQRLAKARLLITQRSHGEALRVLNPLFATLPETWEPWFWMGTAQLGVGDLDKAENAFMEGLVRDDSIPQLWVQRAVIDQQRGQYGLAMDALRQAELLDPNLPEVQLNLAYNFERQGEQNLARGHYEQYLALTEGQSSYHAVRRKVLERVMRLSRS